MDEKRVKQLEWLRDRLKNVSPTNRSLRLTGMPKRRVFSLEELNQYKFGIGDQLITDLLDNSKTNFSILPIFSPNKNEEESVGLKLSKHLTTLHREVQFLIRDKGDACFSFGFPFITFHTENELYFRAPLVLFPCALEKETNRSRPIWKVCIEGSPVINELIFDALEKNNGTKFPDNFIDKVLDCSLKDLIVNASEVFTGAGLKVHNNLSKEKFYRNKKAELILQDDYNSLEQEIKSGFTPEKLYRIASVKPMKKNDIPPRESLDLTIIPAAVIGQFPMHSSMLIGDYMDYQNNISSMADPVVDQLMLGSTDLGDVRPVTEEMLNETVGVEENDRHFIVAANGTQEKIILAARNMKDTGFVADGPPGTGKSQLIVNLIADNISQGKTTLLVCEKRAALDVVYNRMKNSKLIDHVLLVHSGTRDRDEVFAKIQNTIDEANNITDHRIRKNSKELNEISKAIHEDVAYINRYAEALHKVRDNGLSLFQCYSLCKSKFAGLELPKKLTVKYSYDDFCASFEKIKEYIDDAKAYHSLNLSNVYDFRNNVDTSEANVADLTDNLERMNREFSEAENLVVQQNVRDVTKNYELNEVQAGHEYLEQISTNINQSKDDEIITRLLNGSVEENELIRRKGILSSIIARLPESFVAIDGLDEKEILGHREDMKELLKLEGFIRRQLVGVYKKFFKEYELVAKEELFDFLTKYELIPRNDEYPESVYQFFNENKKLLNDIFEGVELPELRKLSEKVGELKNHVKDELVVKEDVDREKWSRVEGELEKLDTNYKSLFRIFNPEWYKAKRLFNNHVNDLAQSIELTSFNKRKFVISNLSFLEMLEKMSPYERELELEAGMSYGDLNSRIDSLNSVLKCLDILKTAYEEFVEFESASSGKYPELNSKFSEFRLNFYNGSQIEIKQFINDLNATRILVQHKSDTQYFQFSNNFPTRMNGKEIKIFIEYLDGQLHIFYMIGKIKLDWIDYLKNKLSDSGAAASIKSMKKLLEMYILFEEKKQNLNSIPEILESIFDEESIELIRESLEENDAFETMYSDVTKYLGNYGGVISWKQVCNNINEFEIEMLNAVSMIECKDPFKDLRQAYLENWIESIEKENIAVKNFSEKVYNEKRNKLKENLDKKYKLVGNYLAAKVKVSGRGNQPRDLERKLTLKRRKKTMREMFRMYYESSIRPLFPVMLLGPETVSQMLPNQTDLFDVVIFDEASQLELHKAIPAAFRGEVIFVTGDEHQLPPNRVARSFYVEDEEEGSIDIDDEGYDEQEEFYNMRKAESFLDQCIHQFERRADGQTAKSGRLMLDWHYRSEHEDLINFSNHAFYKGHIQIAPHPGKYRSKKAIYYHKVEGLFIKKRNQTEAEKIVKLLKEMWMGIDDIDRPTVGVVTFSGEQQDAIWDEVDRAISDDREFGRVYEKELSRKNGEEDVGFFVRNIENVQGDERDVIIFSVGYAPEVHGGDIKMRFGTFSQEKGENRLNVAITRAKKEIHIVASIDPSELRVENTTNLGPKLLQKYLKYCKMVDESDKDNAKGLIYSLSSTLMDGQESEAEFGSDFEIEVYEFLLTNGYKVKPQVGCSGYKIDLAVIDPAYDEKYLCGIECDGATYHSSKDARERDIYRQSFLEDKGWKIIRVWSSTWFHQRIIAEKKLLDQLKKLVDESGKKKIAAEEEHERVIKKREESLSLIVRKNAEEKKLESVASQSIQNELFESSSQGMALNEESKVSSNQSTLGECLKCGGQFQIVDVISEPKFKCKKCAVVQTIPFETLEKIVRKDVFCPRHKKRVLKLEKGRMGVFMKCDFPICKYITDVQIKPEYGKK